MRTCNKDVFQQGYMEPGYICAMRMFLQPGYKCLFCAGISSDLIESTTNDDIAARLNNCVGGAQLGSNLLAPNLVNVRV